MISSNNEHVLIWDLSDLSLHIIFDGWWASLNGGSKGPIAWIKSRHAPSWWFYLHCRIEETGSPGIISIVYHQVLCYPSEHGTGSIRKQLLAKAHIAKLNEWTESEVTELTSSTVDETALAILKRQGSRGIKIVSSQSDFIIDIQVDPYLPKWQTKCSKLAAKDIETSEIHHDTWNLYLMSGFVSAHIPWNAISNRELRRSCKTFSDDLVLPSTMTLTNSCQREDALTVDAMNKQLPSQNKVSLTLDGCTSTNKLAITSDILYYMDGNWALHEVQLPLDEVDRLFVSCFES